MGGYEGVIFEGMPGFEITPQNEAVLRQVLHVPPRTKKHLHSWVKIFLGIDLPDCTVCDEDDEHAPSTSNPMSMLWEMYSAALAGNDPTKTYYLYYSSRDSYKSILASIMEALFLFVLRLDCGHMAAVVQQATNVTRYLKNYLKRPILCDFTTSKNERTIEVTRYDGPNGEVISPVEYAALSSGEQKNYRHSYNYIQIVVATLSGTNSLHCEVVCLDELDLAPPQPIQEAQMMVSQGRGNTKARLPLIFMTSTRKFPFGLVQKAIDEADKTGLIVRNWNIIDITEKCPIERHRPDLPRLPIYRSPKIIKAISEQEWEELEEEAKEQYIKDEGYGGCLENCKMFAACRGWLATKQTSTSPLLKTLSYTQGLLRRSDIERAKSQLLCWKPSTEGVIYPHLDRAVHMLTAAQMAQKITGENYDPKMTKEQLVAFMKERELRWYSGWDWGFRHNWAVVIGAKDGNRMFIVEAIAQPELEIGQKLQLCEARVKPYDPVIFPDMSYPSDIKTFRKAGFRMRDWNKGPGSVDSGIEIMRLKLAPAIGEPQLYFLAGDPGIDVLFDQLQHYHYTIDSAGRVTDQADEEDNDLCDACRYLVMNVFAPKGKLVVDKKSETSQLHPAAQGQYQVENWMQKVIQEQMGDTETALPPVQGKKGGFHFNF